VGDRLQREALRSLFFELKKIGVNECPFFNFPAAGRSRWDRGLTAAANEALPMDRIGLSDKMHGVDPG
jgi:hypothetical protein